MAVGGKSRVHELAKELGVPAKELLSWLAEHGEFAKSASSTLAPPVARRLREHYSTNKPVTGLSRPSTPPPAPPPPLPTPKGATDASPRRLTRQQTDSICRRFRKASASGQERAAINQLYRSVAAQYGVTQAAVRSAVEADFNAYPAGYAPTRSQTPSNATQLDTEGSQPAATPLHDGPSTDKHADHSDDESDRPRPRTTGLPSCAGPAQPQSVVDLVMNLDASQTDRDVVDTRIQAFAPDNTGRYGYLAWRYSNPQRHTQPEPAPAGAPHHDLAAIASIVDAESQLVDQITRTHGAVLQHPDLARRAIETEFRDLLDIDDVGRSAPDELRRVRARDHFLRRAVVLTVASRADERLWDMLARIRPPAPEQLVETNPSLESAITRLNNLIDSVETLLTTNENDLDQFFDLSRTELLKLHAGQYEFLRQFHDLDSTPPGPHPEINPLAFALLPGGETLRDFLAAIRTSGRYRDYKVDEQRLTVLEDIEKHFGASRCRWHEGTEASSGVNNQYLVLSIKSANGIDEDAVAISPLAGLHATYVVRSDCSAAHWATIFAHPKSEARLQGARKLLFNPGGDPYGAMRDKVINLLECPRSDFIRSPRLV